MWNGGSIDRTPDDKMVELWLKNYGYRKGKNLIFCIHYYVVLRFGKRSKNIIGKRLKYKYK